MIEIEADISGIKGPPMCRIVFNGITLHEGPWGEGRIRKRFLVESELNNHLIIEHYGKKFGEGRIWDHQELHLHDIFLDGVSIRTVWHSGKKYYKIDQELKSDAIGPVDMIFGYNGCYELNFSNQTYDWIISERAKNARTRDKISSLDCYTDPFVDNPKIDKLLLDISEEIQKL